MPAVIEEKKCIRCKLCISVCPEPNTILFNQEKNIVTIDKERCKLCGLCVEICPKDAIELMP